MEKLKNKDLELLQKGLSIVNDCSKVQNDGSIMKFKYAVSKNLDKVSRELEHIKKSLIETSKYKEFEIKRKEVQEKYCKKDENGKPLFKVSQNPNIKEYDFEESIRNEFEKEIEIVSEPYKSIFEDYEKLLNEEVKIEIYKIKLINIPEDINQNVLNLFTAFGVIDDNE
ncbi:conserved hypothetical protein [Gammaproteobacteria bacterium]